MDNNSPLLIVITPVRNEAWVLEAFLTHCSSWADRIIIADQHSTDGSREIAARFPKVTLIDNPDTEMQQANARKLLFKEVDCIAGDKIIFTLDADEFLSNGFRHTDGWKQIVESKPGSIFCIRWQNLIGDYSHMVNWEQTYNEWVCHFNATEKVAELYSQSEKRAIHESRVPCPVSAQYIKIEDIRFIHLARLNKQRTRNKNDFYQVSTIDKLTSNINGITFYRTYNTLPPVVPTLEAVKITSADGIDLTPLIHIGDNGQHYIDETVSIIRREGYTKFQWLSIWDNPDLQAAGIHYRPPLHIRIIHRYLHTTQKHSQRPVIRAIDKLLKIVLS